MDATVALGVAGLAATGGTTIWLRWLDNRRHAHELAHERAMVDRAELRDLLDEASILMRRTLWEQAKLVEALRDDNPQRLDEQIETLQEFGEAASLMVGRLSLRLDADHEVTKSYDAMVEIYLQLNLRMNEALPTGFAKYTGSRKTLRGRLEGILDQHEREFLPARRKFIAAAHRLTGADLSALTPVP